MHVRDRLIVVTGAGNGIGQATALRLLAKGARVAAVDLSEAGLARTVDLAGPHAGSVSCHPLSVTDQAALETLPAEVEALHGQPIDGLINIAGIIHRFATVNDLSIEEIEKVIDVNFWGTVRPTKAMLPALLSRPEALLVNVASMGSLLPFPGQGAYGASKGAVRLFTDTLYAELDGSSVQVGLVFPGAIDTNITGNSGVSVSGLGQGTTEGTTRPALQPLSVERAAEIIVQGIESGRYRILIGRDAKAFDALSRLAPTRSIRMIARKVSAALGVGSSGEASGSSARWQTAADAHR